MSNDNTKEQQLPEAPISLTTKVKSPNGFEHLLTLRKGATPEDFRDLMEMITDKEKVLLAKGWTPLAQNGFKKESKPIVYVEGRTCPWDDGRLIKPEEGTNRPIKCENNKYDWKTKTASGCKYIEWPDRIPEKQVRDDVKKYTEYPEGIGPEDYA